MATFEELFPDQAREPFEPVEIGRVSPRVAAIRDRARQAISLSGSDGDGSFDSAFGDLLSSPPSASPAGGETEWSDYGRSAVSGVGDIGASIAGAGEYAAGRFAGSGETAGEQTAADIAQPFGELRRDAQAFSEDWASSMTPEAQARAARELATLDPNRTIWQGGPGEFLSSIGLKMSRAAPSVGVTLLPGALMMRAGLSGGGIAYLGASEGGLSLGSIATNIATEIEQADETELMQSDVYRQLRARLPEAEARQVLTREAQGYAPVIGGLVVGAISAASGRYLEPVLTDAPAGLAGRFGRGFASEAAQESGQSSAEQIAQNIAARVFDSDRSPMEGVGEQALQGGVVGGLMGGGMTAALGPRPRTAIPTGGAKATPSAAPSPAESAPESFDAVFGDQTGAGYTGAKALPDINSDGQRMLDVGPVDPAIQAALNARRDGLISDMFDQPPTSPLAGPGGADMQEVWTRNEQMDLPQGPPGPGQAVAPPVGQQALPLTTRMQGVGRVPVEPMRAEPMSPDMSAPPAVSGERLPPADLLNPGQRRPTRADFLRQRAEDERQKRYKGTFRDENQLDMVGNPDAARALAAEVQDAFELTKDQRLPPLLERLRDPSQISQVAQEFANITGVQPMAAAEDSAPLGMPDAPSREPIGDLIAQLEELRDPDSDRGGVYLSRDNIENLRRQGTFERVRGVGVPLPDFDGKGGTLIARDRAAADEFLAARSGGTPMQEILGVATGAGVGKALGADIAVQQRDEQGNVVRESLVGTPEEADALAENFDAPGREGVILSAPMAIRRREQLVRQDARQAEAGRDIRTVRRRAEEAVEGELGDTKLARQALGRVGRKTLSENEAARRLVGFAARVRKKELAKRLGEADSPDVLEFENLPAQQSYGELFGQYRDAEISEHMAGDVSARVKAKAKREAVRRQLVAFRRLNKATTPAEKIVRAAKRLSREEVSKVEREARETATRKPGGEDILDSATRRVLERATDEQLQTMNDSEVGLVFMEAANLISGSRAKRSTVSGPTGETTAFTPHGKTLDELIAAHPTRSEKLKLIDRARRMIVKREMGGRTKTRPITASATKRGVDKQPRRKGTFQPTRALDILPPRELSKADAARHNKRVRETYHALNQSIGKLQTAINTVMRPAFATMARQREANGNPPQSARNLVYGRVYLRALYRYGQLLERLHPRSPSGLKEVERFNSTVEKLASAPKEKFVEKLAQLTEAEISEQADLAHRSDPTVLSALKSKKRRQLTALLSVQRLKTRIAWSKRLHDVWHTNSKYNEFVAPLMQKLIGYVTHDSGLADIKAERRGLGYKPTFSEMRNLRYALHSFKQDNRKDLFLPLKRWFEGYGFKFDGDGDLVLARNAAQYDYSNLTQLLHKERDRAAFRNAPLNYNEKVAAEKSRKLNEFLAPERKRWAELSPARKRLEQRRLARKIEGDRREGMSYQQRSALESMDRRDSLDLELQAVYSSANMPGLRAAARTLADKLEVRSVSLTNMLQGLSAALPSTHPYQNVIQRILLSKIDDVDVRWDNGIKSAARYVARSRGSQVLERTIGINRKALEEIRAAGADPSAGFIHALLHEAVHASTIGAIRNDPNVKFAMWAIMRQAKSDAGRRGLDVSQYGFTNPEEFVAEAFTNARFQDTLRQVVIDGRSLWQKIVDLVARVLGLDTAPQKNALELVLATSDRLFTGEVQTHNDGMETVAALDLNLEAMKQTIGNAYDKIMQANRVTRSVREQAKNTLEANKEGGTRFLLSALTMEQIRDFYSRAFGGRGPLSDYMKAFFQRNADNSANMESADKLSRRWTEMTERLGPEGALALSRLMTNSTLYGIHPDESLSSPANAHVKSATQKQRHAELAGEHGKLGSEWKQLYADVKSYYGETLRREVNLMTLNAIRAAVGQKNFAYTEGDVTAKRLSTIEGMEKEFGDALTDEERKTIARMAAIPQRHIGPYFPLMRFGDYVVTAERVVNEKTFTDPKDARRWAAAQREDDPTVSVSSPIESGGKWTVSVREKEVRMAETPSEAEANRQEMIGEYGSTNVSQVQLKAQLYNRGASISSSAGLRTILGKLDGNPAAQAAIKDFYLRSIADGAFRKREIKRANRRGVDADAQHRTFANYAKSSAYYTSQLRFGWQMADALIDMQKYVDAVAKGEKQSPMSAVRLGEVVREIDTRDKLTHDHVEVSRLVRGGTELSQFMMLTSPSYWMINATQPYMVTLPWLAARSSVGDATAALLNAQKLIASPIVNQMGESFGGLKALWSKTSAEKAFTVLEQVEEYIKQRGGARADEYIAMLNKLKRDSIIDLSFVAELRDIAQGQDSSLTQRVLDASRIMSHLTEVNNRILTALAAYDLSRNGNRSVEQAQDFAKQAVSLTQFNYSAGNAPRLFQARGPLGQMGPLVFQFMKYPQHMYALLIDNMRRAVQSGGIDRQVALKTLAGLFGTHLAAGGIIGAMLQPIKWAIGLTLAAFGDDDEPYTIKNALSGETFDRLTRESMATLFGNDAGEILSAGVPRAAGIDLSTRMSLGSLYFIDLKTDTAESTIGSLAGAFGGPLVNLGMGFWNGAQRIREGQFAKGMEAYLPKGARDALRAVRYSNEGLTDATGKEILGAKEMKPWDLFLQSIGFQPSKVAETYAGRAAIKDTQSYDTDRRNTLMARFRNATTAGERDTVISDIRSFNRSNPEQSISRSQLLRSIASFREREANVRRFGADLRGKQRAYAEEGEIYNDGDEE